MSRLDRQLEFLYISDRLKTVTRQNRLHDGSRDENVAEHSWHLTLMALLFAEHAPEGVDLAHVIKLLIVHDLVEIYAGDTMILSDEIAAGVRVREEAAAEGLFALLPDDQRAYFMALWREFEARETAEARFAKALDALHPPLLTWGKGGKGSRHHDLRAAQVVAWKRAYLEPYPELWALLEQTLNEAVADGILQEK